MIELVICGASLPTVCVGQRPPEEIREQVNSRFTEQLEDGYRVLPRILHAGTDEEIDNCEDGSYEDMPAPLSEGEYRVRGAIICDACYCTLCILSPSGRGQRHELAAALRLARMLRMLRVLTLPKIG